jgi:hypothetical protein
VHLGSTLIPPPLMASITMPTGTAFVDDNNRVLQVMGNATGGLRPYQFAWTTNPLSTTLFGQSQTLAIPGPISLTNGRGSAMFTVNVTDSQNHTSMATGNVIVACSTTKVTTGDIGDGVKPLFQACGKINTHGVQPASVHITPMGNSFGGFFNVFETQPNAMCPTQTPTLIICSPPKTLAEDPFGYVGGVFEMLKALATGQAITFEEFDAMNALLGSMTFTLP